MKLYEEFKLWEDLWDTDIVEAGNNYTLPNKRLNKTTSRPPLDQYFNKITSSREAATDFIINNLAEYTRERGYSPSSSYYVAMSKATSLANMNVLKLDRAHNYAAFVDALSKIGITKKDIAYLWATKLPDYLKDAEEVFTEITSSAEAVKNFMCELGKYHNKPSLSHDRQRYEFTYAKWFKDNTNANFYGHGGYGLKPDHINWRNFVQTCGEKFNYTARDLTKLFREAECQAASN